MIFYTVLQLIRNFYAEENNKRIPILVVGGISFIGIGFFFKTDVFGKKMSLGVEENRFFFLS